MSRTAGSWKLAIRGRGSEVSMITHRDGQRSQDSRHGLFGLGREKQMVALVVRVDSARHDLQDLRVDRGLSRTAL